MIARAAILLLLALCCGADAQIGPGTLGYSGSAGPVFIPDFIFFNDPTSTNLSFFDTTIVFPPGITVVTMIGGSQAGNNFPITSISIIDDGTVLAVNVNGEPIAPSLSCFSSCPSFTVH